MILNPSNYQFEPFDLEKALAGKPLAATFDNNGTVTYKLVEQFYRESSDFALYKVLIESTYYTFNSDGVGTVVVGEGASAEEVDSQLWMCKGIIDPVRPSTTDEVIETGPEGDTQPFYLPSLNFRETVALQALNAIIGHYDNPIGYNAASIKLMITKAFEFAGEFVNQAVKLRVENASEEGGEYIVEDPPEIAALKEIKDSINTMKSAFIGGTEQNPVKLIDQVTSIKTAMINESANPTESVLTKLDEIVDALGNSIDAQTIADGIDQSSALQAIHGVLATDTNNIQSDVHSIATETNVIREALHNPNNANDTIFGRVQGIGNDTDVIRGEVTEINNKIQ